MPTERFRFKAFRCGNSDLNGEPGRIPGKGAAHRKRFRGVHSSALRHRKIYLRLEPLGLELVAQAAREAGQEVRLIDLEVESHKDYFKILDDSKPDVVAFSCNYLANAP